MIKQTIKYEDLLEGEEREMTCHFHMHQHELLSMEAGKEGSGVRFSDRLKLIAEKTEPAVVIKVLTELIDMSYGDFVDVAHFHKTPEILEAFKSTPAYSALLVKLATDTDEAIAFVNGIMPKPKNKK